MAMFLALSFACKMISDDSTGIDRYMFRYLAMAFIICAVMSLASAVGAFD